jgi:hypothetical protein
MSGGGSVAISGCFGSITMGGRGTSGRGGCSVIQALYRHCLSAVGLDENHCRQRDARGAGLNEYAKRLDDRDRRDDRATPSRVALAQGKPRRHLSFAICEEQPFRRQGRRPPLRGLKLDIVSISRSQAGRAHQSQVPLTRSCTGCAWRIRSKRETKDLK